MSILRLNSRCSIVARDVKGKCKEDACLVLHSSVNSTRTTCSASDGIVTSKLSSFGRGSIQERNTMVGDFKRQRRTARCITAFIQRVGNADEARLGIVKTRKNVIVIFSFLSIMSENNSAIDGLGC